MKNRLLTLLLCLVALPAVAQIEMHGWHIYYAYNAVQTIQQSADKVFALSAGVLFEVDKETGLIEPCNKLTGLTDKDIVRIQYDTQSQSLLIFYANGNIDFLHHDGSVTNVADLYNAQFNGDKSVNGLVIDGRKAYLAMNFGILVLNLDRKEVADTYYIGPNATNVAVQTLAIENDSLYAMSSNNIYCAALKDNLVDYAFWHSLGALPAGKGDLKHLVSFGSHLCVLRDSVLYTYQDSQWKIVAPTVHFARLRTESNRLYGLTPHETYVFNPDFTYTTLQVFNGAADICFDAYAQTYWFAFLDQGVARYNLKDDTYDTYLPDGPISNTAYRIRIYGDKLFVVPGGYLAVCYDRPGEVMVYEQNHWRNYPQSYFKERIGIDTYEYSDAAADPLDPSHFYVASWGYGLLEFRDNEFYKRYNQHNSPIAAVIEKEEKYTWVDALMMDAQGNLWMYNNVPDGVKILTPQGAWFSLRNAATNDLNRVKDMLISNKNPNIKFVACVRSAAGIGIFDDKGTLSNQADDRAALQTTFVDQDGNKLTPENIFSMVQDNNGALWVGTKSGLLTFPNPETLFTSNRCTRIKIPRNDGTNLADYLLNDEAINALAVDGANRKWIGTASSGLYLMSADGVETLAHFTAENSPLLSNTILSIAINDNTGEVFIGTDGGLVSYQSDAAEAKTDFSEVYAYPNPVRADFEGVITIAGLMENSTVKITDAAGNLLCTTYSNGGIAIWDGKDGFAKRACTGVYYALCNSADGAQYAVVKILLVN